MDGEHVDDKEDANANDQSADGHQKGVRWKLTPKQEVKSKKTETIDILPSHDFCINKRCRANTMKASFPMLKASNFDDDNAFRRVIDSFKMLICDVYTRKHITDEELRLSKDIALKYVDSLDKFSDDDAVLPIDLGFQMKKSSLDRFVKNDCTVWLNDECINLIVHMSNTYVCEMEQCAPISTKELPSCVALPSSVQSHFGCDYDEMKGNPQEKIDDPVKYSAYSFCCGEWYSERSKDYLSTLLDAYDRWDELPLEIIMPYNFNKMHWIHLTCTLQRRFLGVVESVNYMPNSSFPKGEYLVEMQKHRMLLSKFMGMYMEEKHNETAIYCGPSDMHLSPSFHYLEDEHRDVFHQDNTKHMSFYHFENDSEKLVQSDGHNCGILVGLSILKMLLSKTSIPLLPDRYNQNHFKLLRYNLVRLVHVLNDAFGNDHSGVTLVPNDGKDIKSLKIKSSQRSKKRLPKKIKQAKPVKALTTVGHIPKPSSINPGIITPRHTHDDKTNPNIQLKEQLVDIFKSRVRNLDRDTIVKDMKAYGCVFVQYYDYDNPPKKDTSRRNLKKIPVAACIYENYNDVLNNPVIIIQQLATKMKKEGFGYGSELLRWLGLQYHDESCNIYSLVLKNETNKVMYKPSYKSLKEANSQYSTHAIKVFKRKSVHEFFLHMEFDLSDDQSEAAKQYPNHDVYYTTAVQLHHMPVKHAMLKQKILFIDPDSVRAILFGTVNNDGTFAEDENASPADDEDQPHLLSTDDQLIKRRWYGYNVFFGWKMYREDEISKIDNVHLLDARSRCGYKVRFGGGARDSPKLLETWNYGLSNINMPIIRRQFRAIRERQGACVWMSACTLVNLYDQTKAQRMIKFMNDQPAKLQWMNLFKSPKKRGSGGRILALLIRQFQMSLKKVPVHNRNDLVKYLHEVMYVTYVTSLM